MSTSPKSKIERAKGAPIAHFVNNDVRIETTNDRALQQFRQLIKHARKHALISQTSADVLNSSITKGTL